MHRIIVDEGLTRYYALANGDTAPVGAAPSPRTHAWLEPLVEKAQSSSSPTCALELDVQGIHCAACVWLMNEVFRREQGGVAITVNPALGKVRLLYRNGAFSVEEYVRRIEAFGYQFGPSRKKPAKGSLELPIRLGISVALAMNVMLFSVSFYMGLAPKDDGDVFALFTRLSLLLSSAVVIVGGWPFFRSAWQGLKTRVLHLDLPIAMGILLVYGVSLVQARSGRGDLAYFDTLNTFITLMLVGRWLQQRVLEKNRRFLLEDDGADGIVVRRRKGEAIESIRAPKIDKGDVLLIAPGDLVPVDATLMGGTARISTDWITGESETCALKDGGILPAGSFNAGRSALQVAAMTSFQDSPLSTLLRQPAPKDASTAGKFWTRLSTFWVAGVLLLASVGYLAWLPSSSADAIHVAIALLVVTCPCAIGIAIPLSYELTQAKLRRDGLFIRSPDLLDRLVRVKKVLFDKTGTLTLGRLELVNARELDALTPDQRDAAYNLAVRSSHPVSACIAQELAHRGVRYDPAFITTEEPGKGTSARVGAVVWRLGRAQWAVTGAEAEQATILSLNGDRVFGFQVKDAIRRDAKEELSALAGEGFGLWLISGDSPERATAMAELLGIPADHTFGGQTPEAKAELVRKLDARDTLYLGDGVNDSLAFDQALCAGTPAIDRPVMPGKSDFFLLGEGLQSLREGLSSAKQLRSVVRRILGISLAYNVLAVAVSMAGLMTPLRAAIAMPVSSLSIILFAIASLRSRKTGRAAAPARKLKEAAA